MPLTLLPSTRFASAVPCLSGRTAGAAAHRTIEALKDRHDGLDTLYRDCTERLRQVVAAYDAVVSKQGKTMITPIRFTRFSRTAQARTFGPAPLGGLRTL